MSSIARLVVEMLAKTGSFETDMSRAAMVAEKRAKEVEKSAIKLGAAVGAYFAGSIVAIGAWTREITKSAKEIETFAQIAGTTNQEFQRWAAGAATAGISQQKMGDIFKDVNEKIGEYALTGGGELKAFFDKVSSQAGIAAKDFHNLSGPQALGLFFSALEKGNLSNAQMVSQMEKLSDGSSALIPLLKSNAQGMKEAGDAAERYGAILSEDVIASAGQFRKETEKVDMIMRGIKVRVVSELLPSLQRMSEQFFSSAQGAVVMGNAASSAAAGVKILLSAVTLVVGAFSTLGTALGGAAAGIVALFSGNFKEAARIAVLGADDIVGNLKSIKSGLDNIWTDTPAKIDAGGEKVGKALVRPFEGATKKVKGEADKLRKEAEKIYQDIEKRIADINREIATFGASDKDKRITDLRDAGADSSQLSRAGSALDQLAALEEAKKIQEEVAKIFEETRTPAEKLADEMSRLDELFASGALKWEEYGRAMFAAADDFEKISEQASKAKSELDIFSENAAKGMQEKFADFFFDPFEGGMEGMVKSFGNAIRRMIAEALAANLTRALFGDSSTPGSTGVLSTALSAFGGFLGFGGPMADGGAVSAGTAYLVGERGREMFVPNTDGTIVPNNALGKGGANINYSPNIHIDSRADQAYVQRMVNQTVRQGNAELVERLTRAGAI